MLRTQLLRRRRVEDVDRRDRQEDDHVDRDVEEDLVQNVDVEVDVDEVLEVDVLQLSRTMSKRKTKLAKLMSRVVAKWNRREDAGLVEEDDVEEVVEGIMMSRCGGVMSLDMGRVATLALLPC